MCQLLASFQAIPIEPTPMNLSRYLICSALALSPGFFPVVLAQTTDDSYAWIQTSSTKHASFARRRETMLLRAARLAEERGYTHFELMQTADAPVTGAVANDTRKATDAYGNASNALYPPRLSPSPLERHESVLVRFCNESVESCPGVRAHRVLLNLRP